MDYIVVIVEGDVAFSIPLPTHENLREQLIAAYMSNPTFVLYDKNLTYGSEWDGTKFTNIVEKEIYTGLPGELNDIWDGKKFIKPGEA